MATTTNLEKVAKEFVPASQNSWKVLELLGWVAVFLAGVVWFGGSYANQDPLWFYAKFEEQPTVICIYKDGAVRELRPGDPHFASLVSVLNQELPHYDGYAESVHPQGVIGDLAREGCTQPAKVEVTEALTYYRKAGFAIEMAYGHEVQLHTAHFFPEARHLLIALDGPYNYINPYILFRGSSEKYLPNGLILKQPAQTLALVEQILAAP